MRYSDLDILFLTKEIPDYIHDAVHLGLCQLGCNVLDYPDKPSLHGTKSPKFHSDQLLFNLPRVKLRKKADLMIVTSLAYDYNPMGTDKWKKSVVEAEIIFEPARTVALDGSDKVETILPLLKRDYSCVFKREMFKKPSEGWHPMQFAAIQEPYLYRYYDTRDLDFTYMAAPSCDFRSKVAHYLRAFSEKHGMKSIVFCGAPTLARSTYLDNLSRSRCSVSVQGMGYSCYRYFEIPAKGTVMVAQDVGIPFDNDFDDTMCYKFKDLDQLGEILLRVRDTPNDVLEGMAMKAQAHYLLYHTPKRRAAEMLSVIYPGISP